MLGKVNIMFGRARAAAIAQDSTPLDGGFFMKTLHVLCLTCVLACSAAHPAAFAIELVRGGVPTATIVVAPSPTRAAQLAAAELQYHVRKITGATLPIAADQSQCTGARIFVGQSAATLVLGLRNEDFQPQEYLIKFLPDTLVLMGRDKPDTGKFDYADAGTFPAEFDDQSTCYAVYDFLERCAQVRWYLPTELGLCCPATRTLRVSGTSVRRSPAMKHRDAHIGYQMPADLCGDTVKGANPPANLAWREQLIFARRHRLGGALAFSVNHSLYGYYERFWKDGDAKPASHFESYHPEFFAQGYSGRPPQMCYANPGLVRQVVQDARDYFDGKGLKPGAVAAGDFFAIVPMDNSNYCKCPKCVALVGDKVPAVRGKGMFTNDAASNYVFGFINDVAKEIKKSHPQKRVAAIAYANYAFPPTNMNLESNIWIKFCLHARNLYSPAMQDTDRAVIDAWLAESKVRPKLLWLYYCFPSLIGATSSNTRCFPGFFAHTIVDQMRAYREAGIGGISYEPSYLAYEQHSPLFDQLEFYVTWKLADDPSQDGNALIDEFFDRYYGAAAKPMKIFYELVEQVYANPNNYPLPFRLGHSHQTEEAAWNYLGTQSRMDQLGWLMEQARALATTDIEKQRVALFDKGIWHYMQAGREAYLKRIGHTR
jgi:hypothetical protein